MITIDGLVSGLDTASIVDSLLEIQQTQIDRLDSQKAEVTDQQTAFKGIEAQLLALRGSLTSLGRSQNNVLESKLATSSDEDILQVSAGADAVNGFYSLKVNSLAAAHQIASQSFASADEQITTGDISFQVGNRAATTVTVDSTNNTVNGLVDAINNSSEDVFASLVTDSSGVRILLTSNHSGVANDLQITNNLGPSSGNAVQPDFSGQAVQEASDASITIGSGAGAITVTSETNQFENVIDGLTFNINGADPSKTINVSVKNNTEASSEAIKSFVDNFNLLMEYIDDQTAYNVDNDDGGPLQGDRSAIAIQNSLRNRLVTSISGISTSLNQLSSIGIDFDDRGHLFLDDNQLNKVLNGEVDGVTTDDVRRLFSLDGQSSIAGVEFLFGSSRTQASTTPYLVDITQAAEQASINGTADLAASIVIDSSNNNLEFEVDGKSTGVIQLTEGTYTQAELADHLESVVNSSSDLNGQSIDVNFVDNRIQITSNVYGAQSELGTFSGSALATLQIDSAAADEGQDVAGNFIVDGVVEEAKGNGRLLTGNLDNANTADIQLRVTLSSDQITAGTESELSISRGFASDLDLIIGKLLDPVTGQVKNANESFNEQIESIEQSIASTTALITAKSDALIAQFAAMEQALSSLQSTNSFLVSQLGGTSSLSTGV